MKSIKPLFALNANPAKQLMMLAWVGTVAMILGFWILSPSKIIPGPMEVLDAFGNLMANDLIQELWHSLEFNLLTLLLVVVASLSFSYLSVVPAARPAGLLFSTLRFLGPSGFVFLFTLLLSTGHQVKIALLVFAMAPMLVTSINAIIANIPKKDLEYARTLRMKEWQVTWEVVILGTRDQVFDAVINASAVGWMMLTMIEGLVRSEGGLGVMLLNFNKHLELAEVYALQFTVYIIGLCFFFVLSALKRKACPHAYIVLERR